MQTLDISPGLTSSDGALSYNDVVKAHDKKLLRDAIAVKHNGELKDLSEKVVGSASFDVVTKDDPEGLDIIRHSTAHLLAQAVKTLYPTAQVTIGPVIENGFYYDFYYPEGFKESDLNKIELQMKKIAKKNSQTEKKVYSRNDAIQYFDSIGEHYKSDIIRSIPEDEQLTLYQHGDFSDLCRGPHVPSASHLKHFKLMKLSGAYWRGDSKNAMLQRVYGTAWATEDALENYLALIKEQEKRDHRKIVKQMDLWHTQPEAPGMMFWHPNGWIVYQSLMKLMRRVYSATGFSEVHTPMVVSTKLSEASGHLEKFSDDMFLVESEKNTYAIKPMNCPCHVQIFNQKLHSYRDLPIRLGEFGCCHRNEDSGALSGMMRTRQFVQDDGHVFCTPDQIEQEVSSFLSDAHRLYRLLGFDEVKLCLPTRPEKYVGSIETWDMAEKTLIEILDSNKYVWELQPGEGAFYGPKIELSLKDCMGRYWQCGTAQLDFAMPGRLGAKYIDKDSEKQIPVMIHRAILGSLERFLGIMIEQTMGHLPLWMMPTQVIVLSIATDTTTFCHEIANAIEDAGIRVKVDDRNEKIGYKIREASLLKIPYMVIIGHDEMAESMLTYRHKSESKKLDLDSFIDLITQEAAMPKFKKEKDN